MNAKTTIFLFQAVVISFCNKNDDTDPKKEFELLKVGSDENVIITKIDTIITGGYNHASCFDLDVNKDNIPDFRFSSEVWGSPGIGQHPKSTFICLHNNALVYGYLKTDSTFVHKSTNKYTNWDSSIVIANSTIYTCSRISNNDSILKISKNQFKIKNLDNDAIIYKTDVFKSDTITLGFTSYSYPTFHTTRNDTTFYNNVSFDNTCDLLPSDKVYYLAFKLIQNQDVKLGWIKLSVVDQYKIYLMEYAIQN